MPSTGPRRRPPRPAQSLSYHKPKQEKIKTFENWFWKLELVLNKMGERYNIHSQLEHLQSKYIGTGHADTTKYEWATNQHRDTYASYMGHFDMMNYFSIAENESKARIR